MALSESETISGSCDREQSTCLGVLHICGLVEGHGKRPLRFSSSAPDESLLHGLWACPL